MRSVSQPNSAGGLRVALYPRVSSDKQVREGYGLSYQERNLRAWADDNGWYIVEVVIEPGMSWESWSRPGLDRIRKLAAADKIDAVLAWKRDRFFGDPIYRGLFEKEMEAYGVKLKAMDDSGGDNPEDEFSDGVKDLLAKLEVRKTAEWTRQGKVERALRDGKFVPGQVPYGFVYQDGRLQVDPTAVAKVATIFQSVGVEAMAMNAVKRAFEREGIPNPSGGKVWYISTIRRIIDNDIYLARPHSEVAALVSPQVASGLDPSQSYGVYWYSKTRQKRIHGIDGDRRIITQNDPSDWIAVPIPDSGIPPEWVLAAREAVKNNVRPAAAGRYGYPLKGFLYCPCGCQMTGHYIIRKNKAGEWHAPYHVCTRLRNHLGCEHGRHHRAQDVEQRIFWFVADLITKPGRLIEWIKAHIEEERHNLQGAESQIAAFREELAKVEKERERYKQLWAAEVITDIDELKGHMAALDARKASANEKLEGLQDAEAEIAELNALVQALSSVELSPEGDGFVPSEDGFWAGMEAIARIRNQKDDDEMLPDTYRRLRMKVVAFKDGSLEVSGIFGSQMLPSSR